ncbi:MAG: ArgR family transcriptional regulator [Bacteroidales bacterium]|nr:ArgR family transcriptional regulator [Bacteroidales bacterium]
MQNIQFRHKALVQIIGQETIYSQEELQTKLQEMGIKTTQATLSRDLKALRIMKVPGEGYRLPQSSPRFFASPTPTSVLSLEFSGQMAVMKTQPGFASAVASLIDHHPSRPILGTLAGDDTVLLILRQGFSSDQTVEALEKVIPEIKNHLI